MNRLILIAQNFWLIWDAAKYDQTPLGRLLLLCGVALILLLTAYWNIRAARMKSATPSPQPTTTGIPTSDLLDSTRKEMARVRIEELSKRGNELAGKVPTIDIDAIKFCEFWAWEANEWGVSVGDTLLSNWGKPLADHFNSLDGFNSNEPVGNVNKDAADAYRRIMFRLRILAAIRPNLL